MMGSGKTTIGKSLSRRLEMGFADIDAIIEKKVGLSISEIFEMKGEKAFREEEEKYIDYVVLSKIRLDHWARDDLYEKYLIDTLKIEPLESALQRSIATMMDWAEEQNVQWSDYFRLVNTNRAVSHIQQGRISPWLILGCNPGKKMLNSFTDEQLTIVEKYIEPAYWTSKFKQYPADHMFVQETVKGAKIE